MVYLAMLQQPDHYEVFLGRVANIINADFAKPRWNWIRRGVAMQTIASDGDFDSLEDCFASVRSHAAWFGTAPVKVNLQRSSEQPKSTGLLPRFVMPARASRQ
jgi:hypothetical protein